MTAPTAKLRSAGPEASTLQARTATYPPLPAYRVNLMRAGYLLMAVGLAVTRWPLLGSAASRPVFEGVVTALLAAMSLLA